MAVRNSYIDFLNRKLEERGRSLDGRPIWRLVWSTDLREKRLGEFHDFYGDIYLRTTKCVKEVPKYWYAKDRWVLERLTFLPPNAAIHKELIGQVELDITKPTMNGSYEPIYVFQDKDQNPLEVTEWAIEAVLQALEKGPEKKTDGQMRDDYFSEIDADARYFEAELENQGRSALFAFENSVFMDSKKRLTYTEKGKPDEIVTAPKI